MSDPNNNVPVPQIVSGVFAGGSNPNAIAVGNPNTAIGRVIAAIQAANPATGSMGGSPFGSNGSTINSDGTISNSLGTATGQSLFTSNLSSLFGPRPNAPDPDAAPTADPTGLLSDPTDPANAPTVGVDPETGLTPAATPTPDPTTGGSPNGSPDGPAGGPGGNSGSPSGGGDSGNPGDFKRGGKVRRPDPRKLSGMLKKGAKVRTGDDDDETDDVEVRLTKGETVLNKTASDKHAKTLAKWNADGNRLMGGFGVGQPRTQRR